MLGPNGGTRTVLVVEDDGWLRALLAELLASEGFEVLEATNGQDGLKLASTEQPQAIVLDLVLPRKSGWEVLDGLRRREEARAIPVIVMSGEIDDFDSPSAMQSDGVDVALPKPLDIARLFAEVDRITAA